MRPVGPESVPDPLFDRQRVSSTRRIVAVLLFACVIGVIAALVVLAFSFQSGPDVQPGMKVDITIPSGASAADVAQLLADEGVVANRTTFLARLRLHGDGASFRAGTYRMLTGSSYDTIVRKLNAGPPPPATFTLTFPEGGRIADNARRIEDNRDARAAEGAPPLPVFSGEAYTASVAGYRVPAKYKPPAGTKTVEGFLFPATFELATKSDPADLIDRQLQAFEDNFASIDMSYAQSRNLTPYEVVIIASLVEREARLAKERPLIAAVIYNRLKERMTLGIDATIQYAVSGPSGWKTTLTQSDLEIDSPFNSRTRLGLPPTPIANPGLASLQAAARPAKVDYLYYVANPDASKGNHFFTKSFDEFNSHPYQQR